MIEERLKTTVFQRIPLFHKYSPLKTGRFFNNHNFPKIPLQSAHFSVFHFSTVLITTTIYKYFQKREMQERLIYKQGQHALSKRFG
ncbi:MAG TPA: hypothetical protein DCP91_10435 [Eggerthellaceae bacterium]|nr:hypothetical protein [Eggerthellaceae bacterium]